MNTTTVTTTKLYSLKLDYLARNVTVSIKFKSIHRQNKKHNFSDDYLIYKESAQSCSIQQSTVLPLESSTVITYSLAKQWINNSCCSKNDRCICDTVRHFSSNIDACNSEAYEVFGHDGRAKDECYENERSKLYISFKFYPGFSIGIFQIRFRSTNDFHPN